MHSTLLQKRDGRFYLALWQELLSWNVKTKSDISVPTRAVTLTLPRTASFRVYKPSVGTAPVRMDGSLGVRRDQPDASTRWE